MKYYSSRTLMTCLVLYISFLATAQGQTLESRINELVRKMTLEEKVKMIHAIP